MTDPNLTTACLQVAGRLLTQREARNGYQSSHLALVNRSDLTLAMNLLATASTRIEGLEAAVDLQGAAADANAQANAMRRMLGDALAVMECNDPRQPILAEMRAALGKAPATLPLEIAGSLLPDDYVSPRLAAEAYRENWAQAVVGEPTLGDAPSDYSTNERHKWLAGWKACAAMLAAQQNREKGQ